MREVFVTTTDNPYDYFDNFEEWYEFDRLKGYKTCDYVARLAKTSSILSDELNMKIIEDAVDEICKFNLTGNYKKIEREVKPVYVKDNEGIDPNKYFK